MFSLLHRTNLAPGASFGERGCEAARGPRGHSRGCVATGWIGNATSTMAAPYTTPTASHLGMRGRLTEGPGSARDRKLPERSQLAPSRRHSLCRISLQASSGWRLMQPNIQSQIRLGMLQDAAVQHSNSCMYVYATLTGDSTPHPPCRRLAAVRAGKGLDKRGRTVTTLPLASASNVSLSGPEMQRLNARLPKGSHHTPPLASLNPKSDTT